MDRALQHQSSSLAMERPVMNLKCVFHVSPATIRTAPKQEVQRPRMPSLLDVDVEWVDDPAPRGTSIQTWSRARGWESED